MPGSFPVRPPAACDSACLAPRRYWCFGAGLPLAKGAFVDDALPDTKGVLVGCGDLEAWAALREGAEIAPRRYVVGRLGTASRRFSHPGVALQNSQRENVLSLQARIIKRENETPSREAEC